MKYVNRMMMFLLLFLAIGTPDYAQVTTGTISGMVTDHTGAVLPGAKIVVLNEETGIPRTVFTDASGRYLAPLLSLGRYRVTATLPGFQTETRTGIVLTVGRQAVVDLQLNIGAVSQSVEVTGEAPLIETKDATVGYLVEDRTIRDLPLNGRDLSQLILLNPGVTESVNAGTNSAYAGFGKKISITGMRPDQNSYLLDGSYINDMNRFIPAGPGGALLGAETVREFKVVTNSYSAQYGRVLGGVFNAVSKSGTNDWHGDIYEFLRNDNLDAAKWEDNLFGKGKPEFERNQFGATFGGPIKRDKTFFFLNYEALRQRLNSTQANVVPDLKARQGILPNKTVPVSPLIAPYLKFFPLPSSEGRNFGDGTAEFIFQKDQETRDDFGQARIDYQISDSDSLFVRGTGDNSNQSQVDAYPDFRKIFIMNTRLLTLSETRIFSPRMLNRATFSFNRVDPQDRGSYPQIPANLLSVPGQPPPGLQPGSGITNWEGPPKPLDRWLTNRFNFQDDVNWTRGGHSLQFGGMVERLQFNEDQPNRPFGEWTFRDLENFLLGNPRRYRGTPPQTGSSIRGMRQWMFDLYVQDDWQVTPHLTLNLGARWEPYTVPTEVNGLMANQRHLMDAAPTVGEPYWKNKSWGNIGPRFGFAWSPFAMGKTSLRGGIGLFYTPNDPQVYRSAPLRTPPLLPEFSFSNPKHFPNALAEIASQKLTSLGSAEAIPFDNMKSPHALQYSLHLQQQLGASNVLTLGYSGSRGLNLTSFGNYNEPLAFFNGVSLEIPQGATTFNPNMPAIYYYANNADSWYNGGSVAFQRRFAAGFQAQVSYTYSRNISTSDSTSKVDRTGSSGGELKYPHDLRSDKSLNGSHLANVFSLNYSYDLPFGKNLSGALGYLLSGWQLTGIVSLQDGQPFTVEATLPSAASALQYGIGSPNLKPDFTTDQITWGSPNVSKDPSGKGRYFNPGAYSAPGPRELGNVGRNTLLAPGLSKWDMGITKNTQITERWQLQFRGEFFNILNRPNFGIPATIVFSGSGSVVGSAGVITRTVTSARQIQFGLKVLF